jgi:hypothetical protein
MDEKEATPENDWNYACFCSFLDILAVVLDFLTMQYKHNIRKLVGEEKIYLHSL